MAHLSLEPAVTTLKVRHPILMMSDLFLNHLQLGVAADGDGLEQSFCLIKEVEDVMETSDWGQEAAIGKEILAWETW